MLNTDTTQPPHPLSLNDNSNVGSINNVEQVIFYWFYLNRNIIALFRQYFYCTSKFLSIIEKISTFLANGECNGSAISPQANRNVHRPRSAGAVARQQEYIRQVASPTNQSILHLQKAKQEEQHQVLEREEERPYNHVQLREFSPQSIRSPIHSSENHSLYQTSSPSPTKSSVSSTPIQDYYAAAGAPNVASYSASNLPNSFPNGGHPTHQYYSQPV